jgi:hypothetical protein
MAHGSALPQQIAAFSPTFWGGPLYHDTSKAFYAAVNGGTPLRGSLLSMLNPIGAAWKVGTRAYAHGAPHSPHKHWAVYAHRHSPAPVARPVVALEPDLPPLPVGHHGCVQEREGLEHSG